MSLSFREKESFYRSLAHMLRSGQTFPAALESLRRTTPRGALRSLMDRLRTSATDGCTIAESFARQRSAVGELELGTIAAVERTGRLDGGLTHLAQYFGAMAQARASFWRKSAYPIFLLHFGILTLALPSALFGGGVAGYLRETLGLLAVIYAAALAISLLIAPLREMGAASGMMDALLRTIPLVGKIRRSFSVSRFCSTYGLQLDAGVNAIDALQAAGRASRSGLVSAAVRRAVPEVRGGGQVGPLLAGSGAFPAETIRAICVGEETGALDQELQRLAAEHQAEGLTALDTLAEWVPRLIYVGVCIYVGFRIVNFYAGYMKQVQDITDLIH